MPPYALKTRLTMRVLPHAWRLALTALALVLVGNRAEAAKLVPDPSVPDEMVRQALIQKIVPPATLGAVSFTPTHRGPLVVDVYCKADLILNENLYVTVPSTDRIFLPVSDRLTELKRAQAQLDLVPKDFVAANGGPGLSASLSFLKHTFVRTTVSAQTHASVDPHVIATHTSFFFGGGWMPLQVPLIVVPAWSGQPIGKFSNPLADRVRDWSSRIHRGWNSDGDCAGTGERCDARGLDSGNSEWKLSA